ncbi:period circadian protein isoform X2 [Phlebotomus argentipes]|uniref:period circadian protein isoform X2 n=1 Tax=Phlebotomus argentipes TaxID=94469 RepID=UPI0028931506|nr:period circadian protein isoform X2 [Phlebotomus argentipes]
MESTQSNHNTKISDSAYSNSCSNSQSQRSGSSKSRHSGSNSSGSSGYGGKPSTQASSDVTSQQVPKRTKDKERKKKKLKSNLQALTIIADATDAAQASCSEIKNDGQCTSAEISLGEPREVKDDSMVGTSGVKQSSSNCQDISIPSTLSTPSPLEVSNEQIDVGNQVTEGVAEMTVASGDNVAKSDKNTMEDCFCCVISMHDGVVLFTTPSITESLGFPRDMWLGRSFIDFVHPKDRATFASQITSGVAVPFSETKGGIHKDIRNSLFVMLRRYRGLRTAGYGVTAKAVSYEPYRLVLSFREAPEDPRSENAENMPPNGSTMLLVICATPVKSIYKSADEILCHRSPKFSTRHTAAGILSHVEGSAVGAFGYLPQDMIGRSIMDFYHPEDYPYIKEVYETVMRVGKTAGASFCSKPYRFLVHNGCYVTLETEWTSFVNPWSRQLEFVIGHHRVLRGPPNPSVFSAGLVTQQFPEDVLNEAKKTQEKILCLLTEPVSKDLDTVKQQVSKRCLALASFMETLMDEVTRPDLKLELPQETELTISERDSVMLGEISPHHDYYDSKSSSETPPSYNQLNYNENLQRFFESKPITIGPDEAMKVDHTGPESSGDPNNSLSPVQCFGSGSGSAGNLSSGSNIQMDSTTSNTGTGTSSGSYQPPTLTEALLSKHNDDMEKMMLKRHRELRTGGRSAEKMKKGPDKSQQQNQQQEHSFGYGVKRSGSHSWEGVEAYRTSKHQHLSDSHKDLATGHGESSGTSMPKQMITVEALDNLPSFSTQSCIRNVDLWPPFSVSLTTIPNPNTTGRNHFATPSGIFPAVYYIPATQKSNPPTEHPGPPNAQAPYAFQYMASVVYPHPSLFGQQFVYPHPPMMYQPLQFQSVSPSVGVTDHHPGSSTNPVNDMKGAMSQHKTSTVGRGSQGHGPFQRPSSQATSVKAEPGSNMGSIASASVVNRDLSESSKKEIADSPITSLPDPDATADSKSQMEDANKLKELSNGSDDSSMSSFYSSFLKTDASSGDDRNDGERSMQKESEVFSVSIRPSGVQSFNSDPFYDTSQEMQWDKGVTVRKPWRRPEPPWLDNVSVTPDLVYRYQVTAKAVTDVLKADMSALKLIHQPGMVNDQLDQLYLDLELEGLSAKLSLSETTSSGSSGEEENPDKKRKKQFQYGKLMMIYEENAPFPPPIQQP